MVESVLSTVVGLAGCLPKSLLEQLFCREPVDASFCIKKLYSRRYLKNFSEFLKQGILKNSELCWMDNLIQPSQNKHS